MSTILVTGASGFVGQHLLLEIRDRLDGTEFVLQGWSVADSEPLPDVDLRIVDLTDEELVLREFRDLRPDYCVHLAAVSHVPTSLERPTEVWKVNTMATLNLLESVRKVVPHCRFLYVSSSEVYAGAELPASGYSETSPLLPVNPYGTSKAASDLMVQEYRRRGLRATVIRPFNHVGPGQSQSFVVPSLALQIADIRHGRAEPLIRVGNLSAERDFLDVRDVAKAYCMLLFVPVHDESPVYNLSSGVARSIESVLEDMLHRSGVEAKVVADLERFRPVDIPRVLGDATKFRQDYGWRPEIAWDRTIDDILGYYGCTDET